MRLRGFTKYEKSNQPELNTRRRRNGNAAGASAKVSEARKQAATPRDALR